MIIDIFIIFFWNFLKLVGILIAIIIVLVLLTIKGMIDSEHIRRIEEDDLIDK